MNKTFTANGSLDENYTVERASETFVYVGLVSPVGAAVSSVFDGATVLICKVAADGSGNLIVLKEITSLTAKTDRGSRFILPGNAQMQIVVIDAGGSTDLYVELQSGPRRNP